MEYQEKLTFAQILKLVKRVQVLIARRDRVRSVKFDPKWRTNGYESWARRGRILRVLDYEIQECVRRVEQCKLIEA